MTRERKDLPAPQRSRARAGPLQGGHLTDDGRWLVVDGRRWRAADTALPDDVRARLLHHLGVARSAVRTAGRSGDDAALAAARARVQLAKTGLGERGPAWWEQDDAARRARWEAALTALDDGA
ncbi:biopolymer transporter Tol [Geodermatophilus sp. DSM 44513]|uniref:biopolymer transporter Tol n=1 Tax=Geodermatophilus sp. DSM 44513 TaxID=1528104 RepID=UPI00126F75AB|nr:biopolymer transporter Tol [Geodermatophilus sp. DSM 44513]WNV76357.1 biopolymer transporter Tol [Geodermatophilus sp. DSM 44513]